LYCSHFLVRDNVVSRIIVRDVPKATLPDEETVFRHQRVDVLFQLDIDISRAFHMRPGNGLAASQRTSESFALEECFTTASKRSFWIRGTIFVNPKDL
jgi:hypothetical protein